MESGRPQRLATILGSARVAAGIAFAAMPGPLGRLLIGRQADGPGTQLFIRAFGARDALLGAGTVRAARGRSARSWLLTCGLADAFDAAATATGYRRLPPIRRALTLTVSVVPAVLNLGTARRVAVTDDATRPGAVWRWMYRSGRPNRAAALLNRGWEIAGSAGLWPNRLNTLEVRGRRTGRPISFPLMVADYGGERYLVAMLGERANWVANVRAAGGRGVLRRGRREAVRLEEVDPRERAPILRRYLQVAPGARPHIPVDRRASLAEFERVAARYPVFRVHADTGL